MARMACTFSGSMARDSGVRPPSQAATRSGVAVSSDASRFSSSAMRALDLLTLADLLRRRQLQRRLLAAVEEGEELVILALLQRIELVIVTLAAADRQAEKNRAGRVGAIDDRLDAELFEVDAAFLVDLRVAMEAGGDALLNGRVRQQIAGQLLDDELIERHVAVEVPTAPSRGTSRWSAAQSML